MSEPVTGRVQWPQESVVRVLALAKDRTAVGLLNALDAAGYKVVPKITPARCSSPEDPS